MRTLETRYALALLDLTQDEAGLEKAAGLLTGDAALWQALNNPCIPGKEKDRVLSRLLEGTVGKELLSFFRLLCARERLALLPAIQVGLEYTPEGQVMRLNGEDVTSLIRTPEVSMATSACSAIPAVRAFLLQLQRDLAEKNNVLMDGRDIGTVVLPHAQLKVFLTASPQERARRRVLQLEESGRKADYEAILRDIQQRDYQDSHREAAPLKPAEDSVLLDTTGEEFQQSKDRLVALVRARL